MGNLFDIINVPLALLLKLCYTIVQNYGVAIILFAVLTKALLYPLGVKGEKSRLRQVAVQPKVNALQQKYKGNTRDPKYNEELQALYKAEGFSPFSGCLPQLIQLPIILGLWNVIRQPLTYISGLGELTRYNIVQKFYESGIQTIVDALGSKATDGVLPTADVINWLKTSEIKVATLMNDGSNYDLVKNFLPEKYEVIKMNFFGLNLGFAPSDFGILAWTILIPVIAGASSFLVGFISQKLTALPDNGQKNPSMNFILYFMPLISVWFGYSLPIGVGIYWIASNLLAMLQTLLLKKTVRLPEKEVKAKEKKLNYTQIEKMKREGTWEDPNAINVPESEQKEEDFFENKEADSSKQTKPKKNNRKDQ